MHSWRGLEGQCFTEKWKLLGTFKTFANDSFFDADLEYDISFESVCLFII
jgi:hypothetical protein